MAQARRDIVSHDEVSTYMCTSRCVRRAFLCGYDSYSAKSFQHRKIWIYNRLAFLVKVFAVETIARSIMSNHLHIQVRIRPDLAKAWSSEEVALRWLTLCPPKRILNSTNSKPLLVSDPEVQAIINNPTAVETYRKRLCSISWFNGRLNEYIARRANKEDGCTGRFWEGRFHCKRIFDVAGIIATAAYIDLNPIRAQCAVSIEDSDYTSAQERIYNLIGHSDPKYNSDPKYHSDPKYNKGSPVLITIEDATNQSVSTLEYLALVDQTGRFLVGGKRGRIPSEITPLLEKLNISISAWEKNNEQFAKYFRRAIGTTNQLRSAAKKANKLWFHGHYAAKLFFSDVT